MSREETLADDEDCCVRQECLGEVCDFVPGHLYLRAVMMRASDGVFSDIVRSALMPINTY